MSIRRKRCGVAVKIDADTGRATSIERFQLPLPVGTSFMDAS